MYLFTYRAPPEHSRAKVHAEVAIPAGGVQGHNGAGLKVGLHLRHSKKGLKVFNKYI